MSDWWGFLIILAAVVSGYFLGMYRRRSSSNQESGYIWPKQNYYKGLTYLLNDETDSAIDSFISSLDVNPETLEIHLALGNLLRKRGEVSRAIRVHQNLLARPSLSKQQLQKVQLELAVDYQRSGLLDRAESLFRELAELRTIEKSMRVHALERLVEIYQDTNEWLAAIDIADRLTVRKFSGPADDWREKQAQYSCELAEEAFEKNDLLSVRRWCRSAQRYDRKCVRATLIEARLEFVENNYSEVISILKKVPQLNPRYSSEVFAPMHDVYSKGDMSGLIEEYQALYADSRSLVALKFLVRAVEKGVSGEAAMALLLQELEANPLYLKSGVATSKALLKLFLNQNGESSRSDKVACDQLLDDLLQIDSLYQCQRCGFDSSQMYWLCPSCKSWTSISAL